MKPYEEFQLPDLIFKSSTALVDLGVRIWSPNLLRATTNPCPAPHLLSMSLVVSWIIVVRSSVSRVGQTGLFLEKVMGPVRHRARLRAHGHGSESPPCVGELTFRQKKLNHCSHYPNYNQLREASGYSVRLWKITGYQAASSSVAGLCHLRIVKLNNEITKTHLKWSLEGRKLSHPQHPRLTSTGNHVTCISNRK